MNIATFGEILMRLSAPNRNRIQQSRLLEVSFAGSEANVAVNLAFWGLNTRFISAVSEDEIGQSAINDLSKYKVDTSFIHKKPDSHTGLYFLEVGSNQRPSKVLYYRQNSAFSTAKFEPDILKNSLANCGWFHWSGITPGLSFDAIDNLKMILLQAQEKGLDISCDINYRNKLWKFGISPKDILPDLLYSAKIIMGNEEDALVLFNDEEFSKMLKKKELNTERYQSICKRFFDRFPNCEIVCFTIRNSISADHNQWQGVMATRSQFYYSQVYEIHNIVDRVGAGDSFSSGIIYGLMKFKNDYQKTLDFATAASCLKHSINGDYCLYTSSEIIALMEGNLSGRILR